MSLNQKIKADAEMKAYDALPVTLRKAIAGSLQLWPCIRMKDLLDRGSMTRKDIIRMIEGADHDRANARRG